MRTAIDQYNSGRILVGVAGLSALVVQTLTGAYHPELARFFTVVVGALLVPVVAALVHRYRPGGASYLGLNFGLDIASISVVTVWTGGVNSFFTLLYFAVIGAAAAMLKLLLTAGPVPSVNTAVEIVVGDNGTMR